MRSSYAESQIPADGKSGVPYADRREMVGQFRHGAEMFVGEVYGAGGAGGVLRAIPFEPAAVRLYVTATPLKQITVVGATGQIDIDDITGGAAADPLVIAADDLNPGKWKVTIPFASLADGDRANLICEGCRQVGGSL